MRKKAKRKAPKGYLYTIKTHKIRMDVNNKQDTYLFQVSQYARKMWNMGLGYHKASLSVGHPVFKLRKEINKIKHFVLPWGHNLPQIPAKNALINLETALTRFYTARKKGEQSQDYPRFKNIKSKPSIQADDGGGTFIAVEGKTLLLSKAWKYSRLRLREELRFKGDIAQVVLTKENGYWWAAITVATLEKIPVLPAEWEGKTGGFDPSIGDTLGGYSDHETDKLYENPRFYRTAEQKLAELDKEIARSFKQNNNHLTGKNRRRKEQRRNLHASLANRRADAAHKMTTEIAERPVAKIVTESNNANAWARSPMFSKSTHDASPGTIIRNLAYKTRWAGKEFEQADRHYASTRTCSGCGWFWGDMALSDRNFVCPKCGELHREINSARNFRDYEPQREVLAQTIGSVKPSRADSSAVSQEKTEPVPSRVAPLG